MSGEVVIGIAGLVLSAVSYVVGSRRSEKRHQADDSETRISKVVDEYQKLYEPRRDTGLSALLAAGVLLLRGESEIQEACKRLELRNGSSPLRPFVEELKSGPLLPVLQAVREHKLNPHQPDCITKARDLMQGKAP
jgi:hypothetical protein